MGFVTIIFKVIPIPGPHLCLSGQTTAQED